MSLYKRMNMKKFTLSIPESQRADLRQRIANTRWPQKIEEAGWERGVPLEYLKKLASYWADEFDWQKQEKLINQYDQFITTIDGQPIHFFHIKSKRKDAKPLLLLHGWPSSSIEYLKLIEPLTNPADGASFHLVIPSVPGFGLSAPVTKTGWQSVTTADTYAKIMQQLGYDKYYAHGSDIGSDILGELCRIDSGHIIGAHHANDTGTIVPSVALFMGGGDPSTNPHLSERQKARVQEILAQSNDDMGYFQQQSTRPSTVGYGLNDSPVAQLAWMVEKYKSWTNPANALPEDKIDIDQMLTNISLYWFQEGGFSSANYIYENMHAAREWGSQSNIPTGYAVFDAEDIDRVLMDPEHAIGHWNEYKKGGHFPAMEVPELLAKDIQRFFEKV